MKTVCFLLTMICVLQTALFAQVDEDTLTVWRNIAISPTFIPLSLDLRQSTDSDSRLEAVLNTSIGGSIVIGKYVDRNQKKYLKYGLAITLLLDKLTNEASSFDPSGALGIVAFNGIVHIAGKYSAGHIPKKIDGSAISRWSMAISFNIIPLIK